MKDDNNPAFNYLVSLSSHNPFVMAEKYQMLPGDVKEYDYQTYHYYQSIHYADYALGLFIDGLKESALYNDSLIVVYGDHPAKIGDYLDPKTKKTLAGVSEEELSYVPYIYKLPNQKEGAASERSTSQVDIMPTILNLVGVKTNYPMFGKDLFGSDSKDVPEKVLKEYSEALIKYDLFSYFRE